MFLKNLFTFAEKFLIQRNKLLFAEPALPPVGLLTTGQRVTSTTISLSQIGHFSAENFEENNVNYIVYKKKLKITQWFVT